MNGFSGLKRYQDFRRRDWVDKGYILLNGLTKHKAFIYDYNEERIEKFIQDFVKYYNIKDQKLDENIPFLYSMLLKPSNLKKSFLHE